MSNEIPNLSPVDADAQRDFHRNIAAFLDELLNASSKEGHRVGFCLLTYNMGEMTEDNGLVNYVGNGSRPEVLVLLKALVKRWEKVTVEQPDMRQRGAQS